MVIDWGGELSQALIEIAQAIRREQPPRRPPRPSRAAAVRPAPSKRARALSPRLPLRRRQADRRTSLAADDARSPSRHIALDDLIGGAARRRARSSPACLDPLRISRRMAYSTGLTQGQLADAVSAGQLAALAVLLEVVGVRRLAAAEVEPSSHTLRSPSCAAGAAGPLPGALSRAP
jgi:hypothetical protein